MLILKRRQQNQKFPSFQTFRFAAGGVGGSANKNDRKFLGFAPRELVERGRGAKGWRWHALRAYDQIQSHHALDAWKGQSLRDWKKVRAKVNISAPNDTSRFESADESRACGAREGKKPRRVATKWLGEETEKWADLFLVSYSKIIFINFQY